MKIVYSWLKDFIDITIPVEELAEALTLSGLEVTSIENKSVPKGIIAARIVDKKKHPNADKLSVCSVDCGGETPLAIVCGAPNAAADMLVPCATIGTVFSDGFTIKKAKLRGVESFGMLCSEKEIGISDDHSGLMSLPETAVPGTPLSEYYPDDAVMEIELTPDRGDCLSVLGVAREASARFGIPLKDTALKPIENSSDSVEQAITVSVSASDECPRYTGRLIRGVTIGPSPEWMQHRLSLAGIRPINNIVDITNYMLLHFGQPMHAFDFKCIQGNTINVSKAGAIQSFTTLDEQTRNLEPDDLLICDANRPVALAGIMGGAGSEITDATTDVFLECAYFNPVTVRKTGKRMGLSTDSSYRFERGVDPDRGLFDALETAAALLGTIAGGTVAKGYIDTCSGMLRKQTITLRPSSVSSLLGINVPMEQIISFLESLQISCKHNDDNAHIICTPPLFRHDITIEEDLIEEIGRLFGYDSIPPSENIPLPLYQSLPEQEILTDTIRQVMAFSGMNETVTNSMISEKKCSLTTPEKKPVKLLNPLNPDMACMRPSLLANLLDVAVYNCNRKNINNRLFEIGTIFELRPDDTTFERTVLCILLEGNFTPASWNSSVKPVDFFTLKGIIETFAHHMGIRATSFTSVESAPSCYGNETASVTLGLSIIGYAGIINDDVCKYFNLKSTVCYAELDITDFISSPLPVPHYVPLPRYPALERDFSFVMGNQLSTTEIVDTITPLSMLIEKVVPFDIYRDEKIGPNKKSVTFNCIFRSPDKTLTEKDVESLCQEIINTVAQSHNATLRI